jgi:hypothetical protein
MTDEELGREIVKKVGPPWALSSLESIGRRARELLAKPPTPPPGDVPSVKEIKDRMREYAQSYPVPNTIQEPEHLIGRIQFECACVAHELLLKHAPPRIIIDGMSGPDIINWLAVNRKLSRVDMLSIAAQMWHLINTPAKPGPDSDAEAKRIYNGLCEARVSQEFDWNALDPKVQDYFRQLTWKKER